MTFDTLKPVYLKKLVERSRGSAETLLQFKQDYVYKKVMQMPKHFRDEDDLDYDESVKEALRKRLHLIDIKLEQYEEPTLSSDEEDDDANEDEEPPKKKQRKT